MKSSPFKRLASGSAANLIGKIWVLLLQLAAVPIYTSAWGVDGYGIWLMITTIPTYLALSDLGLATAARIDLTALISMNKKERALTTFQSIWFFLSVVSLSIAIICAMGVWIFLSARHMPEGASFTTKQIGLASLCVIGAATLNIQMNIFKIVFESSQRYTLGTIFFDLAFFSTSMAAICTAFLGGDIFAAAASQLIVRAISLFAYLHILRKCITWCRPGIKFVQVTEIKRLLKPSLAALALQAANSIGLQALVLTIGVAFNPATAALFATARMITRMPLQFSSLITRASLPELTRALTMNDTMLAKRLARINITTSASISIVSWIALSFFGPHLVAWLSKGSLDTQNLFFVLLGAASVLSAIWTALGASLMAVNRHNEYAYLLLGAYSVCAFVPFLAGGNLVWVLCALIIADGVTAFKTWRVI